MKIQAASSSALLNNSIKITHQFTRVGEFWKYIETNKNYFLMCLLAGIFYVLDAKRSVETLQHINDLEFTSRR